MKFFRRGWLAATLLFLGLGLWQTGEAAYIHAKAWLAQQLIARAWEQSLASQEPVRPWPNADFWPIARLRVPAHDIDLYILSDASGRTLAFGPGHLPESALPDDAGPIVIAGHRDTHFRFLREMRAGDVIQLASKNIRNIYVVDTIEIVGADMPVSLDSSASLVLLTCDPFQNLPRSSKRLLVSAAASEWQSESATEPRFTTSLRIFSDQTFVNSP